MSLILLFCILAQSETTKAKVPFTKHHNSMVVQTMINGQGPFPLVLDTGASLSVLSPRVARRLGLRPDQISIMYGVGGRPIEVGLARLKQISLGGASAPNVEAAIRGIPQLNENGIEGLLGQDFLDQFNMAIDNHRKLLTFSLITRDKPKPKRPQLSPLEKQVQEVYQNPMAVYEPVHELYRQLREAVGNLEKSDWKSLSDQYNEVNQKVHHLFQHLNSFTDSELKPDAANNLQHFLYCYRGYRRHLDAMRAFLVTMHGETRPELTPDQAAKWEPVVRTRELYGRCF